MFKNIRIDVSDHALKRFKKRIHGEAELDDVKRFVQESTPLGKKDAKLIKQHYRARKCKWRPGSTYLKYKVDNKRHIIFVVAQYQQFCDGFSVITCWMSRNLTNCVGNL